MRFDQPCNCGQHQPIPPYYWPPMSGMPVNQAVTLEQALEHKKLIDDFIKKVETDLKEKKDKDKKPEGLSKSQIFWLMFLATPVMFAVQYTVCLRVAGLLK